jgi:outer membrane autotransporter protein
MDAMLDPTIGSRAGLADGGGELVAGETPHEYRLAYNGPNDSMPYESEPAGPKWSLWTNVYGQHDQRSGDVTKGYHGINGTTFGGQIGLDYTPRHANGALGVAFGASDQRWRLAQDLGKGHSTSLHVGAYYSRRFDENYFTSALSYGRYDVSTERTLLFGGTNVYDASFSAWSAAARAEIGHGFKYDGGRITPFLSFQATDLGLPNYAETTVTGSPSFALAFTGHHHFDYFTEVGSAWSTLLGSTPSTMTDLHAHLGWLHDFAGGLRDTATFSAFPGASFLVDGAPPPKDAAHVTLGIEHDFNNMSLTLNGESILGSGGNSYGGSLAFSVDW